MTLVITEISQYGIVMGADSAVTCQTCLPSGQTGNRVLTGVHKLLPIAYLQAGVSCWGYGQIGNIDSDIWLNDFILSHKGQSQTLQAFVTQLEVELNRIIPPTQSGQNEAGFHLAGFVPKNGRLTPDFWHLHNGPSQFFKNINTHVFNANHDLAGAIQLGSYNPNNPYFICRNGDYLFYAAWWESFEKLLNSTLRQSGINIPRPSLEGRADYIRFQIRTISHIYGMSTLLPSIGGEISTLTIDPGGIRSFDITP
jgi:hypothetical protein